jgi:hypothetical protein
MHLWHRKSPSSKAYKRRQRRTKREESRKKIRTMRRKASILKESKIGSRKVLTNC